MEDNKKRNKSLRLISFVIYVVIIAYITILSRTTIAVRIVHLVPMWSYTSHGYNRQILLNIALFIPLGYFLSDIFSSSHHPYLWSIRLALLVSVVVEIVQFLTYRGMLDVDDLTSNGLGAVIGILVYTILENNKNLFLKKWMPRLLMTAGLIGCIMVASSAAKSNMSTKITQQFDFRISIASIKNDKLNIDGVCYTYDQTTPDYSILLRSGSSTVTANTEISGDGYTATAKVEADRQYEVLVRFAGIGELSTGTYLRGAEVAYVPGEVPDPDGAEMKDAVLKAYSEEYDTYVYVKDGELLWLIGYEIKDTTEIIYHIHTNEPERLPEHRIQYGFDNRGFRAPANETEPIGHYRVFKKALPTEYNITAVTVGFNPGGKVVWSQGFRVEQSL